MAMFGAVVTVTDQSFTASFGRARVETPLANVTNAHVTRDYQWWKAVGIRLSFDEKVRRVIGSKDHSALTVTVDDLDGLAQAINEAKGAA